MKWEWNNSQAFVVLNDDAVHWDQSAEEMWSLHQYNVLAGSR